MWTFISMFLGSFAGTFCGSFLAMMIAYRRAAQNIVGPPRRG